MSEPRATPEQMAATLFTSARGQIFEDGMESDFSRGLVEFITLYGRPAVNAIIQLFLSERINFAVVSEVLRVLGRIHHPTTYRDRLRLLGKGLCSSSARVRDGATLGLAYLDDPVAINSLKAAIEREPISELREDMEQVLSQLEKTRR